MSKLMPTQFRYIVPRYKAHSFNVSVSTYVFPSVLVKEKNFKTDYYDFIYPG